MRIVTVQARIRDDAIELFLEASIANGRASVSVESNCRRFDIFQDEQDPNLVGFTEVYADDDAVAAHGESEHFAAWLAAVDGMADEEMIWATCRSLILGDTQAPVPLAGDPAAEGASGGRYIFQGRFVVPSADLDGFRTALSTQASNALQAEPGCLRFDVFQNVADPTEIWVYEVYADRAAYQQHREEPHSVAFRAELESRNHLAPVSVSGPNVWPPDDWAWGDNLGTDG